MIDDMTGTSLFRWGWLDDLEKKIYTYPTASGSKWAARLSSTSLYIAFTLDFGVAMQHTYMLSVGTLCDMDTIGLRLVSDPRKKSSLGDHLALRKEVGVPARGQVCYAASQRVGSR
jgi:hypothetical protein